MIKIAPSTLTIENSFKEALISLYKSYLENIKRASGNDQERLNRLLAAKPNATRRALDGVNGYNDERRGMSYDLARFRIASEYTRLYAVKHEEKLWIMGDTKPVVISGHDRNQNMKASWQIGNYCVAFLLSDLASGVINNHFIPLTFPMTPNRHPHHVASLSEESETSGSPLDMRARTCWGTGGFSAGVKFSMEELDIPALFSVIFKYLSRYDSHSVYGGGWYSNGVENVEWMQNEHQRRTKLTSVK